MKPALQFATAVMALGGLLFQAASHATDLAEQPLKASVLAKPNVIFGMDDSGSMDSEVMLYNNDGAFWWNFDKKTGWGIDASHPNPSLRTFENTTHFNSAGDATSTWRKMVYLFPNGTGTGRRVYGDAEKDHFAVMPTSEFAFLRWSGVYWSSKENKYKSPPTDPALSPVHNPIYYNPLVDYKPWATAEISTGAEEPKDASPSAVKSHPMNGLGTTYLSGSGTFDLTAAGGIAADTADNSHFIALPGMKIPAGARKSVCDADRKNCGSWTDVTTDETVTSGVTRVAMPYFPATYWVKEPCTVDPEASVGASACTTAPDGSTLKRYEIKSDTTFPSKRGYKEELQNFANWMQYYRKRKLMLAGAMGQTMETLTGMRLGVVKFNNRTTVKMYDADSSLKAENRLRVAGIFYETNGNGGTPTRETLVHIGDQFKREDKTDGKFNVMQYACQRNNAFVVTDGFANASSVTLPDWDKDPARSATDFKSSGAPYETIYKNSLAEIALRYYINNIRKDLALDVVPKTERDINPDPHMNTYGLTLGARGTLFLGEDVAPPTSISAWPNPSAYRSPTSVDDLWHATINGRGKMYLATTPEETALRIQAGLNDIKSQVGAQSSVAISSFNLLASDGQAYAASYNPSGWTGDLSASSVEKSTGAISKKVNWSADELLRARTKARVIVTSDGGKGMPFTADKVGGIVKSNDLLAAAGFSSEGLIAYLRGDRTDEGEVYRSRTNLMGAVLNAEPVVDVANKVVYLASGEGMLHAFNTETGAEEWAFVPYEGLTKIGETALRAYTFKTKLDGTPTVGTYAGGKLLVAGMGAAGRSYYAIDVTSPRDLSEADAASKVKWSFPAPSDTKNQALMGYTVGRPLIVKTKTKGYVALVTSGYDNGTTIGDGKGRMWMLDASDGKVLETFETTAGSPAPGAEAGLAQINAYRNEDGTARWVYGGDLHGNLWKFDLDTGSTTLLAVLKDTAGATQPVTTRPQLTRIKNRPVVMVGTGRLLDIGDFGSETTQSIYAISDDGSGVTLPSARKATTALAIKDLKDITGSVNWETSRGWHLDIPVGQQVNVDPKFVLGYLHVNANKAGGINCTQSANHYKISVLAEGASADTVVGSTESLTTTANVMSPVFVQSGDKLFRWIRDDKGDIDNVEETRPSKIAPRKNSWREISR
jgi:type IV pilus assembly protein PilY1